MLPFALKCAWFALSLAGLLASLVSLPAVRKVFGCCWVPFTYLVSNVILQAMFCLGMVWRMSPAAMPRAFCITQAMLMTAAWYTLAATCACVTLATFLLIQRSYSGSRIPSVTEIQGVLRWRTSFLFPVFVFPLVALAAYAAVALKLHAIVPEDGMSCDITDFVAVRLLSYAGLPLVLAIPSLILSCISVTLLSRNRHHHYSEARTPVQDSFTAPPSRRRSIFKKRVFLQPMERPHFPPTPEPKADPPRDGGLTPTSTLTISLYAIPSPPSSRSATIAGRAPISPQLSAFPQRYHLPFEFRQQQRRSPTPDLDSDSGLSRASSLDGRPRKSPSPLVFATPTPTPPRGSPVFSVALPVPPAVLRAAEDREDEAMRRAMAANVLVEFEDVDSELGASAASGSLRWVSDALSVGSKSTRSVEFARTVEGGVEEVQLREYPGQLGVHSKEKFSEPDFPDRSPAHLSPIVWRILAFQIIVACTQILATISSLVDIIADHKPPSAFGTQHVALLLATWTPTLIFGFVPFREVRTWVWWPWWPNRMRTW